MLHGRYIPSDTSMETPSPSPAHTGILRYETLLLRQLLRFSADISQVISKSKTIHHLGEEGSGYVVKDLVFIAIGIDTFQGYGNIYVRYANVAKFTIGIS